ncbi:XRE family transcriptional regulator [Gracilibacillus sp. D59]|uniref:XRE family transcriptional regulator n=1 Tax=Gracilibacillus sp. D59 TaxID=3457434 RepID=UPI003FCD85F3
MEKGRASKALKQGRYEISKTQQQLSMETFLSRESVSHQENGSYKVQPEMVQHFAEKYNNPWVALEASSEYIGWGVRRLDGFAADLHRSAVKDKLLEELDEAIEAIKRVKTSLKPSMVQSFHKQDIEQSVQESMDGVLALVTWIAVACEEYNLSWTKSWEKHHMKLKAKQYVKS